MKEKEYDKDKDLIVSIKTWNALQKAYFDLYCKYYDLIEEFLDDWDFLTEKLRHYTKYGVHAKATENMINFYLNTRRKKWEKRREETPSDEE